MKCIMQYVRKDNKLVGCLVAIKYNDIISIGWSYHTGNNFDKDMAFRIAMGRATKLSCKYNNSVSNIVNIPIYICQTHLDKFINRASKYFKTNKFSNTFNRSRTSMNTEQNQEKEVDHVMSDSEHLHLVLNQKKNKPKIKVKYLPAPVYTQLPLLEDNL